MFTRSEKIAVLLSAYNGEKYLKCQIDSILKQKTELAVHLFIRDDGSSDSTRDIIKEYDPSSVTLIEGENVGASESFLQLLEMARKLPSEYAYFAFADQDDRWDEDKLQTAVSAIESRDKDAPWLYGSFYRLTDEDFNPIQPDVKPLSNPVLLTSLVQTRIPGHSHVFNRAFLNVLPDPVDKEQVYYYDGFIVQAALANGALIYDKEAHADYRQHGDNVMGQTENPFTWLKQRFRRVMRGDSKKYAKQIVYIYNLYGHLMSTDEQCELRGFMNSRKNFFRRLKFISHTQIRREGRMQTLLFKLLYLFGGYNT